MLIRDDGDAWIAITQPAHAHLAGQIAGHWQPALTVDHLLAIEQHDAPWIEWDREPPLHAEAGRAAAFYEAPLDERLAIWRHAAHRLEAQSPYAAVLAAQHAINIHTRYMPPDRQPQELLAEARAEQDALLALLPDVDRERVERDADLLFAVDALSLTLCNGWDARDLPAIDGTTIRVTPQGEGAAALEPWPLSGAQVHVGVYARRLHERFEDEAQMQRALAATPYERLTWRLAPA